MDVPFCRPQQCGQGAHATVLRRRVICRQNRSSDCRRCYNQNTSKMFGPTSWFSGMADGTEQNVVGQTLVAMATTFGLGAEIKSPTGLSGCQSVGIRQDLKNL